MASVSHPRPLNSHNWLSIWTTSQHDNTVRYNVADHDSAQCPVNVFGPSAACAVNGNVVEHNVFTDQPPTADAGLSGDYAAMTAPSVAPLPWTALGLRNLAPDTPTPGPEDLAAAGHPTTYHPADSPRG